MYYTLFIYILYIYYIMHLYMLYIYIYIHPRPLGNFKKLPWNRMVSREIFTWFNSSIVKQLNLLMQFRAFSISQSVGRSVGRSVGQSVSQSVSQWVSEWVSEWGREGAREGVSEGGSQWVSEIWPDLNKRSRPLKTNIIYT